MSQPTPDDQLRDLVGDWNRCRRQERNLSKLVSKAVQDAITAGASEAELARLTGMSRTTVRRMIGKEPRRVQDEPGRQTRD